MRKPFSDKNIWPTQAEIKQTWRDLKAANKAGLDEFRRNEKPKK